MATGDEAAAAGLTTYSGVDDVRDTDEALNVRGDELARHMTDGTHPASAIQGILTKGQGGTGRSNVYSHPANPVTTQARVMLVHTSGDVYCMDKSPSAEGNCLAQYGPTGRLDVSYPQSDVHAANRAYVQDVKAASFDDAKAYTDGQIAGISADADKVTSAAYNRTAGSSRYAMWMDGSRLIGRNVSSRRYKEDITAHAIDPEAVLALQPVSYHRIGDPAGDHEYGLIAEDVHEHLPEIVTWYGGQIDGIRYDLLAVALLDVVKDLTARQRTNAAAIAAQSAAITDLQSAVADQRTLIEDLTARLTALEV